VSVYVTEHVPEVFKVHVPVEGVKAPVVLFVERVTTPEGE
jgi:hypothetical protein